MQACLPPDKLLRRRGPSKVKSTCMHSTRVVGSDDGAREAHDLARVGSC